MRKCVFTETFTRAVAEIYSEKVKKELQSVILSISAMPDIGSKHVPESIHPLNGGSVMKFCVPPFDLIYEDDGECVYFYALIHQRRVY